MDGSVFNPGRVYLETNSVTDGWLAGRGQKEAGHPGSRGSDPAGDGSGAWIRILDGLTGVGTTGWQRACRGVGSEYVGSSFGSGTPG